jgi:hypothetical protein
MSSLSLNASIRTCTVETGNAIRIESDRFLNPNNMVCIPPSGFNIKGQLACHDSLYTKTAGCNSALDRVGVENDLRPNYSAYVTLNASGIQGDIYSNSDESREWLDSRNHISGSFGNQWGATNYQTCGLNAYEKAMDEQENRGTSYYNHAHDQNQYNTSSGSGCGGY